jgi:hypothetical protein
LLDLLPGHLEDKLKGYHVGFRAGFSARDLRAGVCLPE